MSAKLRIKTKGIEIEWEGEVDFLKSELPDVIATIIEAIGTVSTEPNEENNTSDASEHSSFRSGSGGKFTTASAAAKLQAKSGPDLFKAALLKLQASDEIEPVPRGRILDEMKLAPRAFKPSMRSNLSKVIESLLSQGDINEPSSGNYVLSQSVFDQLLHRLNS